MKARTIVGLAVTVKIKSHDFRTRDTMDKGFALLKDLPLVFFLNELGKKRITNLEIILDLHIP